MSGMPKPTKPGFGSFVTVPPAYFGNPYQKPPHNSTRSTHPMQIMPYKALKPIACVDSVECVGYNWVLSPGYGPLCGTIVTIYLPGNFLKLHISEDAG